MRRAPFFPFFLLAMVPASKGGESQDSPDMAFKSNAASQATRELHRGRAVCQDPRGLRGQRKANLCTTLGDRENFSAPSPALQMAGGSVRRGGPLRLLGGGCGCFPTAATSNRSERSQFLPSRTGCRASRGAAAIKAGDKVRVHCEWNNTTGKVLKFGFEMCVAFGQTVDAERLGNLSWMARTGERSDRLLVAAGREAAAAAARAGAAGLLSALIRPAICSAGRRCRRSSPDRQRRAQVGLDVVHAVPEGPAELPDPDGVPLVAWEAAVGLEGHVGRILRLSALLQAPMARRKKRERKGARPHGRILAELVLLRSVILV